MAKSVTEYREIGKKRDGGRLDASFTVEAALVFVYSVPDHRGIRHTCACGRKYGFAGGAGMWHPSGGGTDTV